MSDVPLSAPGAAVGRSGRVALAARRTALAAGPVAAVVAALVALWYAACVPMNAAASLTEAERAGALVVPSEASERRDMGGLRLALLNPGLAAAGAFSQERARLPAPHQVAAEFWATTAGQAPTSKRSLVHHAGVTLGPTLLGFAIGSALGIVLAVGIVHSRTMALGVMPWAIASQTVPILALAPMIVVVANSVGLQGLLPKAIVSAYLSFFPVVVGMAKGLRAPDPAQLDLMRTYDASAAQTLGKLRLPASVPYLFASLKIAVAAALVGAIVGELPTGAVAGLGARLLAGSYYGQTVQIWSALVMAAVCAAALVGAIAAVERMALGRMGMSR